MDIKKEIQTLLRQAEIYKTQGLLFEALEKYKTAGLLIKKNQKLIKNKNPLAALSKKIRALKEEIDKIESAPETVDMPEEIQNFIINKFAFAEEGDTAALEGAIALAKFGQFSRALQEFNRLLKSESVRLNAAKNVFRCHMALNTLPQAVEQYKSWISDDLFTEDQLNKLRIFLQGILNKEEIDVDLPVPEPEPVDESDSLIDNRLEIPSFVEQEEEEIIDVSSVGIIIPDGSKNGETIEFDVSFQSGNVINILVPSSEKEIIDTLSPGKMLEDVQFYSPIAMFSGQGIVSSFSKIESGPKKGDYSLDLKIKSN